MYALPSSCRSDEICRNSRESVTGRLTGLVASIWCVGKTIVGDVRVRRAFGPALLSPIPPNPRTAREINDGGNVAFVIQGSASPPTRWAVAYLTNDSCLSSSKFNLLANSDFGTTKVAVFANFDCESPRLPGTCQVWQCSPVSSVSLERRFEK